MSDTLGPVADAKLPPLRDDWSAEDEFTQPIGFDPHTDAPPVAARDARGAGKPPEGLLPDEVRRRVTDGPPRLSSEGANVAMPHKDPGVDPLGAWWMAKANSEIRPLIAKMQEYGGKGRALDLVEIGRHLSQAGVVMSEDSTSSGEDVERTYAELGIYFYLVGKFARWTAAIAEGRQVSDDTLLDIGIYIRMAQRIRETGGWPN